MPVHFLNAHSTPRSLDIKEVEGPAVKGPVQQLRGKIHLECGALMYSDV
jgi:hypothetical protein